MQLAEESALGKEEEDVVQVDDLRQYVARPKREDCEDWLDWRCSHL